MGGRSKPTMAYSRILTLAVLTLAVAALQDPDEVVPEASPLRRPKGSLQDDQDTLLTQEYMSNCNGLVLSYVLFSPNGAIARSIVPDNNACPPLTVDGRAIKSSVHAGPEPGFPVTVCDAPLPAGAKAHVCGNVLPTVPTDPKKYVLIGDTGMRLKVSNYGTSTNKADKKKDMCAADANGENCAFNAEAFSGHIQGLGQDLDPDANMWPYQTVAEAAANANPDVVVHVGDYLYRESKCPTKCVDANGAETGCSCHGVGDAHGDTWNTWYSEFFEPSHHLLAAAPWIAGRGNHENCKRSWKGYLRFIDTIHAEMPSTADQKKCPKFLPTFSVPFENDNFLVVDTNEVESAQGGVDHYDYVCPKENGQIVEGLKPPQKNIKFDVPKYTKLFSDAKNMMKEGAGNFLVSHCPLNAVMCHKGKYHTFEYLLEQAGTESGLTKSGDGLTAVLSGHMHWFQYMSYKNGLVPQVVFGHGGTKLLAHAFSDSQMESLEVLGNKVKEAKSLREFGFCTLERDGQSLQLSAIDGNSQKKWGTNL